MDAVDSIELSHLYIECNVCWLRWLDLSSQNCGSVITLNMKQERESFKCSSTLNDSRVIGPSLHIIWSRAGCGTTVDNAKSLTRWLPACIGMFLYGRLR